jgi:nucleotide-binding universal stress UspA family protein
MFKTIFVAVDGDGGGGKEALRLARYFAGDQTEVVLGPLKSAADAVDAAHSEHADLIVMGSPRDAARVLHGSPVPIAVAPTGFADAPEDRLRVIGVGFDGQPESRAALRFAEQLALEHEATMRVYAVVLPNAMTTSRIEESLEGDLYEEVETLDSRVRAAAHANRGDPTKHLLARAREGLDLLVVGSRRYGPLRRVLFGSVSSELIARAECPVLVLPRQASEGDEPTAAPANIATTE